MRFEKQIFTTDVTLDYNEFIDCEFKECKLLYHGGDFRIANGKFYRVQYVFSGSANSTLMFLRMLRESHPKLVEELLTAPLQSSQSEKPTLN